MSVVSIHLLFIKLIALKEQLFGGRKISDKILGAIIGLFLLCAIAVPVIVANSVNQVELGEVTLIFFSENSTYVAGSGWILENKTDILTYHISSNNMSSVLRGQSYNGFPLMVNASSWKVYDVVTIGSYLAIIVGETDVLGVKCWECEMDNTDTDTFYGKENGYLQQTRWSITTDIPEYPWKRTIFLEKTNLLEISIEFPDKSFLYQRSIILSGIFIELSVISWLVARKKKKAG